MYQRTTMASDVEKWFCLELGKLGIEATEDNARYILSMDDADDLEDHMQGLLDASDPKVRVFLQELRSRCGQAKGSFKIYQKDTTSDYQNKRAKTKMTKDLSGTELRNVFPLEHLSNGVFHKMAVDVQSSLSSSQSSDLTSTGELGIGAKKKTKFINLFSGEGQARSVIQLPGRHICECQAAKHKLINNCITCGRIVCEQEGAGPCVFCGKLVCTPEDEEIIRKGTKKGEKLRQHLMKSGGSDSTNHSIVSHSLSQSKQGFEKAMQHRDKLLEFDRTSVRRTQVIDDECDYYSTDSNQWLSKEESEKLRRREEELRHARHASLRDRKFTFDFAGRRIIDDADDAAAKVYSKDDEIVQQVHYERKDTYTSANIVNPMFHLQTPKFDESVSWNSTSVKMANSASTTFNPVRSATHRLQDKELQEMSDEGMCLSMHQPWASLLIEGVKIHEGRTWYTAHRGRLWIASTAKTPASEEIREMENVYCHLQNDANISFPKDYPTGCLLGCVNVDDCLSQDDYREQYPNGESLSPFVFICSNPQQLIVKFPIKGKHKIYKLDQHIHQAAKTGLR